VLLTAGSASWLLRVPADELAGRHTALGDLWGHKADLMLEQLNEAGNPMAILDALEQILLRQLGHPEGPGAVVAFVLAKLRTGCSVDEAVRATGFSHRHVLSVFRSATGMAPKQYGRVLRVQSLLGLAARPDAAGWAELALQVGYSDQSHFNRDFLAFAGLTPQAWRRSVARHPNHVPVLVG
jgi:AraC-like DNA-binding protein